MNYDEAYYYSEEYSSYIHFDFATGSQGNETLNYIFNETDKDPSQFCKEVYELADKYPGFPYDSAAHNLLSEVVLLDPHANITDNYEGIFIDRLQEMFIKNRDVIVLGMGKHYGITFEVFNENIYDKTKLRNCMKDRNNPIADYIISELWGKIPVNKDFGF